MVARHTAIRGASDGYWPVGSIGNGISECSRNGGAINKGLSKRCSIYIGTTWTPASGDKSSLLSTIGWPCIVSITHVASPCGRWYSTILAFTCYYSHPFIRRIWVFEGASAWTVINNPCYALTSIIVVVIFCKYDACKSVNTLICSVPPSGSCKCITSPKRWITAYRSSIFESIALVYCIERSQRVFSNHPIHRAAGHSKDGTLKSAYGQPCRSCKVTVDR